ncbi:hypothetical protein ONS95_011639 [Cadophora gregata]|uniref:uncharacterized protein n=1 Tax=Cadophora gregata TaxID=51156 RepID=UPI0026DD92A2|nr:uncharacterized protein ONS95_011639 [Cadophora gregata]KAK0120233.1 hypothetical protein ONS95_011639 [Cadophora gregata]KAK0121269.1 hypothetical protein ONS96_011444 [Cadophora gregata f. sp. sojae]
MNALGSGCLILFPDSISEYLWTTVLPAKGDVWDKAIQFLRKLGLVSMCEKEGWNNLGNNILQTVRKPFLSYLGQKSQIQWAANSPPFPPCDTGIQGHERLLLDSRRLDTGRVTKSIPKKKVMRPQTHQQASPAMIHQDTRSLLPLAINDQGRGPLADVSLAIVNVCPSDTDPSQHNMHMLSTPQSGSVSQEPPPPGTCDRVYQTHQGRSRSESEPDISRLGRPGTSTISAILNDDDTTFNPATLTTQESLQDPADPNITGHLSTAGGVLMCMPTTSLTAPIGPIPGQGGMAAEESGPGDVNFHVPQVQHGYQVKAIKPIIAEVAEVSKLADVLGSYLFEGMNKSQMRHREKDERFVPFTKTILLHLCFGSGEDFKLDVWLCSSVGRAISQAQMGSVEALRSMLGDYLFDAMKASVWRQREETQRVSDRTEAVQVFFPEQRGQQRLHTEGTIVFCDG